MMNAAMVTHANAMLVVRECGAVTATKYASQQQNLFFFPRSLTLAAGCQAGRQGGRVARQRRQVQVKRGEAEAGGAAGGAGWGRRLSLTINVPTFSLRSTARRWTPFKIGPLP